jgi:hypothetical protein
MRRWMLGMWVVVVAAGCAAGAQACANCSPDMWCVSAARGALLCLGDGNACLMAGRCIGSSRLPDQAMIQLTLLEDSPALAGGGPSRLLRGAGEIAVGRQAVRIAAGGAGDGGDVVFSLAGYHEGGTAVFRARAGDGFALRRERDGRGARIEVLALAGGWPGRPLARERVDADDALVVRVPFEGRTCILVVQAATLPAAEAASREAAARRELQESRAGQPRADRPPFELRVLER